MSLISFASMLLADPAVAGQIATGAAIAILVCLGSGLAMGLAVSKAVEGISRQPEAQGKIMSTLILGLAFIETTAIYGLVVSVLILFVL